MATRIVVPALGVALTGHLLRKLLARWMSDRYGLVSYSSRLIAAARAVESLRPDAFVVDPLACILAGPQAMAKYKDEQSDASADTSKSSSSQQQQTSSQSVVEHDSEDHVAQQQGQEVHIMLQQDNSRVSGPSQEVQVSSNACPSQPPDPLPSRSQPSQQLTQNQQHPEQRPVPRLIMRTVFFDDAILAAVGSPSERSSEAMGAVLEKCKQQGLPFCRQVVLLGSGMDSRPWRLDLPPGIAWFEVDRHDVLKAKQQALRKSGVSFHTVNNSGTSTTSHSKSTRNSHEDRSSRSKASGSQTYLKAASWSCAAVDLQVPGWSKQLVKVGLDPQQPTAWVAEGLMYYLEPEGVAGMLQEVASVSAPGSILALNFMLESGLKSLREALAAKAAASQAKAAEDAKRKPSAIAEVDGQASKQDGAASKQDIGSGGRAGNSSNGGRTSGLLSQFKWGCPDDSKQFFSQQGWNVMVCLPWTSAAQSYGWQPQQAAAVMGRPPSHEVQFAICLRL
eukprot:GHUV01025298.1.p1 GENE.GHUV01025298.1~~GHUV01025298.1.p1  ORF type:complete len:506 (+),score=168.56 GHUV01025298.1:180-1697(+)